MQSETLAGAPGHSGFAARRRDALGGQVCHNQRSLLTHAEGPQSFSLESYEQLLVMKATSRVDALRGKVSRELDSELEALALSA